MSNCQSREDTARTARSCRIAADARAGYKNSPNPTANEVSDLAGVSDADPVSLFNKFIMQFP